MRDVFLAFLRLGLTSFGGPIAHLTYFRTEFVERRKWLNENRFAQLLALCQLLPGPASSQLGFGIGVIRAGWPGALVAVVAFTLPSALLLLLFADFVPSLASGRGPDIVHGLGLVAVVVVAHGVVSMARALGRDGMRIALAIGALVFLLLVREPWAQLVVIAGGAVAGVALCREARAPEAAELRLPHGARLGVSLMISFAAILTLSFVVGQRLGAWSEMAAGFYRAGALVFGGGHVVLPLLENVVVASAALDRETFLAGYGAAQAVPGPMFSVAMFLGARMPATGGAMGGLVALVAILLRGFLLLAGVLPLWRSISRRRYAARAIAGVHAAVVGLLAAAWIDPVATSALRGALDVAIAGASFALLLRGRVPTLLVVALCIAGAVVLRG